MDPLTTTPRRDPWTVLAELLANVDPFVLLNLRSAIPPSADGLETPGDLRDEALLENLITAATAAREAVETGTRRERKSRAAPSERGRARELGLDLIGSYVRLTGRVPIRSRVSSGLYSGQLSGPLSRFLRSMYGSIRDRVAAADDIAALAEGAVWSPSDEIFANWAKRFRRGDHGHENGDVPHW